MRNLYITNEHPEAGGLWAVCDLDTGELVHTCKSGEDDGKDQATTIVASAYDWEALTAAGDTLTSFTSDPAIAFVGVPTSDRRIIDAGAVRFRTMPLPLMLQFKTDFGHTGAVIAGRFDVMGEDENRVTGAGVLDSGFGGQEAERLLRNRVLRGVSVDLGEIEVETEVVEQDEDGWPTNWLDHFVVAEVMGATLTPFPAFADAALVLTDDTSDDTVPTADDDVAAVTAAAITKDPPAEWFEDPCFDAPTPITVSDDGHITGHIAVWGSCHIGRQGVCVTPPKSQSDYSYFSTGYVRCGDGCEMATGVLTLGGGHADIRLDAEAARRHYDESGVGVGDIAAGEDEHGVWVNGALRPTVTDEQVREIRATSPSGDWRAIKGTLELIAVLQVNVPGFPVPRARTASGEQTALVAAVAPRPENVEPVPAWAIDLQRQVASHQRQLRALSPEVARRLKSVVHGS